MPGGETNCNIVECDDKDVVFLKSYSEVGMEKGFVFAPFCITSSCPVILLRTKERIVKDIRDLHRNVKDKDVRILNVEEDKETYKEDFEKFHEKTLSGEFFKIVLSRKSVMKVDKELDVIWIFQQLCTDYPNSFVSLVKIKSAGLWVMATPEVLLESTPHGIHTMALAGTRNVENKVGDTPCSSAGSSPEWDEKNTKEQKYVSEYIYDCLREFTDDITFTSPRTIKYGNIEHLKSDFYFQKEADVRLGRIVSRLHPTPAVCGLPAAETFNFIQNNEHNDRQYYSGFCGPYSGDADFHLYVTLRCMKIVNHTAELFAGGGILTGSKEEEEWNETKLKMQAMKKTFFQ